MHLLPRLELQIKSKHLLIHMINSINGSKSDHLLSWTNSAEIKSALPAGSGLGLTIGNFDGVHLGHKKLLSDFVEDCKNYNLGSLVLTFDPHPKHVINPRDPYATRLYPIGDLKTQLQTLNLNHLWVQHFDHKLSLLTPEQFIDAFLNPLPIKFLMVGHDFRFGKERAGKIDDLLIWCESKKVPIKIFSPYEIQHKRVSTSLIKDYLIEGDIETASIFLGRKYSVFGEVVKGQNRGEGIGFPTANLNSPVPLKNGVYASKLKVANSVYLSITNVGLRPTVNKNLDLWNKNVETHVPGEKLDLYGKTIEVEFHKYLRPEKKFETLEDLKEQIAKDIARLKSSF